MYLRAKTKSDCKVPCDEHGAGGSGADVGVRLSRLERVAAPEEPLQTGMRVLRFRPRHKTIALHISR